MKPQRAAVIGCGAIAHQHLAHLAASPRVDLVAVSDRSAASARFAAETYDVARWTLDATELLEGDDRPDVIHVLTPPQTHVGLVEVALDAGCHVICEKPLAPTADDAVRLLDRARTVERMLVESHNLLFNDVVLAIDATIAQGTLGAIREVDILLALDLTAGPFGDTNLDGPGVDLPAGAVHDFLPHLAYLFDHFIPTRGRSEVIGWIDNLSGNGRVGRDHLDALVRTDGGRGRLRIASDLAPDAFALVVRGTEGTIDSDLYNPYLRVRDRRSGGKRAPFEQAVAGARLMGAAATNLRNKVAQHSTYHGLPRMLDAIYAALDEGAPSPISPTEIIDTATLTDQLVHLRQE